MTKSFRERALTALKAAYPDATHLEVMKHRVLGTRCFVIMNGGEKFDITEELHAICRSIALRDLEEELND